MERELGDTYSLSLSLTYLGWQLFRIYDFYSAKEAALESLVLYEKINFPPGKYLSLKTYG